MYECIFRIFWRERSAAENIQKSAIRLGKGNRHATRPRRVSIEQLVLLINRYQNTFQKSKTQIDNDEEENEKSKVVTIKIEGDEEEEEKRKHERKKRTQEDMVADFVKILEQMSEW